MKRFISFVLIVIIVVSTTVFAGPGYDPGISGEETSKKGEFKYRETVFLTGEPIILDGTAKVTQSANGSKLTLEYKLSNTAKNAKLERKVVFNTSNSKNDLGNQTTYTTSVDPKFSESVTIGSDKFTLVEYKLSRSGVLDDRAIIKYLASNWNGRKIYARNTNAGEVVVEVSSESYAYESYWSSTETSVINNVITYRYKESDTDPGFKEAVGSAEYVVSNSSMKTMEYKANLVSDISFKGGYILRENQESVVSYSYDIPAMNAWKAQGKRNTGKDTYKLANVPTQLRTFVPVIRDVAASYWAADDIRRIVSLGILSNLENNYFRPLSFISRGEFARAMVRAANLDPKNYEKPRSKTFTIKFDDVDKNHPYQSFITTVANAGIMNGTASSKFSPDANLTKVQAVVILIRALGLEDSSSESSTRTSFSDDSRIPASAKKAVNIAKKAGIISPNSENQFEPNKILTRAECSAMINRFIKYLQYDIKKEYREKIINFGR